MVAGMSTARQIPTVTAKPTMRNDKATVSMASRKTDSAAPCFQLTWLFQPRVNGFASLAQNARDGGPMQARAMTQHDEHHGRSALLVAGARRLVFVMIAAVASQPASRSFHSPDNCSHECEHQEELDAAYHEVRPAVVCTHPAADAARRRSGLRQADRREAWCNHPTDCTQRGQRRMGGGLVIDERPAS